MKYSKTRRKFGEIPDSEFEESLRVIVDNFDYDWLIRDDGHPLQILWRRKDSIASNELFIFGNSLRQIDLDDKGAQDNIKKVKSDDHNNRIGAVFEITSAAILQNSNQKVEFKKKDNPGYDLTVFFNDDSKINISCKNFGLSNANKLFNRYVSDFVRFFLEKIKEFGIFDILCHIHFHDFPDSKPDWELLKKSLSNSLNKVLVENPVSTSWKIIKFEKGDIGLSRIPPNGRKFYSGELSHEILISAPFHKNEGKRLEDKIEDACENLTKHGIDQNEDQINLVLIHLPDSASLENCEKHALFYLEQYDDKPIAGIILLQYSIVFNIDTNQLYIQIGTRTVKNRYYDSWISKDKVNRDFKLNFEAVGEVSSSMPDYRIIESGEVKELGLDLNNRYFYQRGRYYLEPEQSGDESKAKVRVIGPGIYENAVITLGGETMIIKPKAPPHNKLILV